MNKKEFVAYLRRRLFRYPKSEVDEAVAYYEELIDDKVANEGMTEKAAVASLGDKKKIVAECVSSIKERGSEKSEGLGAPSAVMLGVLASPVLFPLAIVVFVLVSVLWIVWGALILTFGGISLGGIVLTVGNWFVYENAASALICSGTGLVMCALGALACVATAYYGGKGLSKAFLAFVSLFKSRKRS